MASSASVAGLATSIQIRGISIGRIFERAWSVTRHNAAIVIPLSLLGAIAIVLLAYFLQGIDRSALVLTVAGHALPGSIALTLAQLSFGWLIGVIMQGAMLPLFSAPAHGTRANLVFGVPLVLRSLLPLVTLGVLTGIAVMIGTTLLIIPGIVVYVLWSVAPSALVDEHDGIFLALDRSHELTQGARWKVFGLFAILEVVTAILGLGSILIAARWFAISLRLQESIGYAVLLVAVNTTTCLIWAAVQASLYVELRQWKDGSSVETLNEVFA